MRARTLLVGVIVLIGLSVGAWAALRRDRPRKPTARNAPLVVTTAVKAGDLQIVIAETGAVAAKDSTPVIPEISGRVAWVCANGIVVKANEDVVRLDPARLQEQLDDLKVRAEQANIRSAQAEAVSKSRMTEMNMRLQQARDEAAAFERQQQIVLREMEDKIAFDTKELEKRREEVEVKRRLAAQGLVTETEVERGDAGVLAAQHALEKAQSDFELKKAQVAADANQRQRNVTNTDRDMNRARNFTERDIRMSGNQVENLALQLQRAEEDLARTVIKAPVGGLVMLTPLGGWAGDSHLPQLGDYVSQGREVASIISLDHMQVKIELDQTQITGVKMGQAAEVRIEALRGKVLRGTITSIGQNARRPPVQGWMGLSSTATFPVTIDLPPAGSELIRPGMRANVRIVARTIEDAIIVPQSCVFRHDEKPVVYVEGGGRFVRTVVTLGESNGEYQAITKGLKAGQRIALNDLGASSEEEESTEQTKERRSR